MTVEWVTSPLISIDEEKESFSFPSLLITFPVFFFTEMSSGIISLNKSTFQYSLIPLKPLPLNPQLIQPSIVQVEHQHMQSVFIMLRNFYAHNSYQILQKTWKAPFSYNMRLMYSTYLSAIRIDFLFCRRLECQRFKS